MPATSPLSPAQRRTLADALMAEQQNGERCARATAVVLLPRERAYLAELIRQDVETPSKGAKP